MHFSRTWKSFASFWVSSEVAPKSKKKDSSKDSFHMRLLLPYHQTLLRILSLLSHSCLRCSRIPASLYTLISQEILCHPLSERRKSNTPFVSLSDSAHLLTPTLCAFTNLCITHTFCFPLNHSYWLKNYPIQITQTTSLLSPTRTFISILTKTSICCLQFWLPASVYKFLDTVNGFISVCCVGPTRHELYYLTIYKAHV